MTISLKKLPTLTQTQEWTCELGCNHIVPKLYENAYKLVWNKDGSLKEKMAEYFYTCQNNHVLEIWDNEKNETILVDERFYQEIKPKCDLSLEFINSAIDDLERHVEKFNSLDSNLTQVFSGVEVSYCLNLKNGEEFSIYLEDFKALRDRLTMPKKVYVME